MSWIKQKSVSKTKLKNLKNSRKNNVRRNMANSRKSRHSNKGNYANRHAGLKNIRPAPPVPKGKLGPRPTIAPPPPPTKKKGPKPNIKCGRTIKEGHFLYNSQCRDRGFTSVAAGGRRRTKRRRRKRRTRRRKRGGVHCHCK